MVDGTLKGKVEKPWGYERIIGTTDDHVVKKIFVKAGHRLSLQYHNKKIETIFLLSGDGYIIMPKKTGGFTGEEIFVAKSSIDPIEALDVFEMKVNEPFFVPAQTIHRLGANEDSMFLELSTKELDDVVRLQDDYGRGD